MIRKVQRISLVRGDITQLEVDAIVNAANDRLSHGAGVCGAIFRAAGPELEAACSPLAPCPTGEARITPGFNARAKWIVHAVGPIWQGGHAGEPMLLASAYRYSLQLARNAGAASIAFPAISTGIYGYPLESATRIALNEANAWIDAEAAPGRIIFCCFTEADERIYRKLLEDI